MTTRSPRLGYGFDVEPASYPSSPRLGTGRANSPAGEVRVDYSEWQDKEESKERSDDAGGVELDTATLAERVASPIREGASLVFVVTAVVAHLFASKTVLVATHGPLAFLFAQLIINTTLLAIWKLFGQQSLPRFSIAAVIATGPAAFFNVLALVAGSYALLRLDLTVFQITRALHLPFASMCSRLFLGETATPGRGYALPLIFIAYAIVFVSERSSTLGGLLLAALSTVAQSLQPVMLMRAQKKLGGNISSLDLNWYTSVSTTFALAALFIISGEAGRFLDLVDPALAKEGFGRAKAYEEAQVLLRTFFLGTLVVSLFGFLRDVAPSVGIQVSSPFLQMISLAARYLLTAWLSVILLRDTVTLSRLVALIVTFGGIVLHLSARGISSANATSPLRLASSSPPRHDFQSDTSGASSPLPFSLPSNRPRPLSLSPDVARDRGPTSPSSTSMSLPSPPLIPTPSLGSSAFQRRSSLVLSSPVLEDSAVFGDAPSPRLR